MFLLQNVFSQTLIITDSVELKQGIYKSYIEFFLNKPSIPFEYDVKSKEPIASSITFYRVVIDKEEGKMIGNIFGFCDGKEIYINETYPRLKPNALFKKIEYLGIYCYFIDHEGVGAEYRRIERILNIFSGEVSKLSKTSLKLILNSDTELLNEFKNQTNKGKHLKRYIIKYSEKHRNDKKNTIYILPDNINSILYKTNIDDSFTDYYNRILRYTTDPRIISMEVKETKYGNGNLKSTGLVARHKFGENEEFIYQIGSWRKYYKNGKINEIINYDIRARKYGLYQIFNEQGDKIEEKVYN